MTKTRLIKPPTHKNMNAKQVCKQGFSISTRQGLHHVKGSNRYCAPAVLAAMSGYKTNETAALLGAINHKRYARGACSRVYKEDLMTAIQYLGFLHTGTVDLFVRDIKTLGQFCGNFGKYWNVNTYHLITLNDHFVVMYNDKIVDNNYLGYNKFGVTKGARDTRKPVDMQVFRDSRKQIKSIETFVCTPNVPIVLPALPVTDPTINPRQPLHEWFEWKASHELKYMMYCMVGTISAMCSNSPMYRIMPEFSGSMAGDSLIPLVADSIMTRDRNGRPTRHAYAGSNVDDQFFISCFYTLFNNMIKPALRLANNWHNMQDDDPDIVRGGFNALTYQQIQYDDMAKTFNSYAYLLNALVEATSARGVTLHQGGTRHHNRNRYRNVIDVRLQELENMHKKMQHMHLVFHKDKRIVKVQDCVVLNKPLYA